MARRLHTLYHEFGQSPWLDNLKRGWLTGGELRRWIARGVRGITSNPTIFQKAMSEGTDYDAHLRRLASAGAGVEASYWELVAEDIRTAADELAPIHEASGGRDGYVSVEVDPALARDTGATIAAARELWERIDRPNLFVKIPATVEGLPAIRTLIGEGRNVNVTLIFSIERYAQVIEAYLAGLEDRAGDVSGVASVASFFVSRVDTETDRRLEALGTPEALALRGQAAIAQAKLAYDLFRERFSGSRWQVVADRGARVQRPLWASTSTKNPAYPDTLYVDELIGPDSVNTLPEATLEAFEDHGTLARTIDRGLEEARAVIDGLATVGVDFADVGRVLEEEGVAAFSKSFDELLDSLGRKVTELR